MNQRALGRERMLGLGVVVREGRTDGEQAKAGRRDARVGAGGVIGSRVHSGSTSVKRCTNDMGLAFEGGFAEEADLYVGGCGPCVETRQLRSSGVRVLRGLLIGSGDDSGVIGVIAVVHGLRDVVEA